MDKKHKMRIRIRKMGFVWMALAGSLALASCQSGAEQEETAEALYAEAEEAFKDGRDTVALQLIDSINRACPKAFDTRQKGVDLKKKVIITQAQETIALADSIRLRLEEEAKALQSGLKLQKDARYEDDGNYLAPSQLEENNTGRSYLRAQVSESGHLQLTSVARSGAALKHTSVRVAAGGQSAATGEGHVFPYGTARKVDYQEDKAAGKVAAFIAEHEGENIRMEFVSGSGAVAIPLTAADRKAIAQVYRYYEKRKEIAELQKKAEDAWVKIRFYTEKSAQRRPPHTAKEQ